MARHRNFRNDYYDDYYDSEEDYDDPLLSYGTPQSPSLSQFMYKNHDSKYQLKIDRKNDYDKVIDQLLEAFPNLLDDFDIEELKSKIDYYNYDIDKLQDYILDEMDKKLVDRGDNIFEFENESLPVDEKPVKETKPIVSNVQKQKHPVKKPSQSIKVQSPKKTTSVQPKKTAPKEQVTEEKKTVEEVKPKKKVKQMQDSTRESVLKQLSNTKEKTKLNTVIIGHVDSGKSTTLGHLLLLQGKIDSRTIYNYEKQSKEIGKSSFQYAWVLDQGQDERSRGITVDIASKTLETKNFHITFLDCPGHKDFIHNMISGTSQAESAILVIDSTESGIRILQSEKNQTKEHAVLARTLGVTQVIVAINKLDLCDWKEDHYNNIVEIVRAMLKQIGYKEQNVTFVPISGFYGENLVERKEEKLSWYKGPTLLEALNSLQPPKRFYEKPFRMSVSDSFKDATGGLGYTVSGIIDSGFVNKGDNLMIMPSKLICSVKGIRVDGNIVQTAFSGQHVDIGLIGIDGDVVHGSVLCDPENPISVSKRFTAQIRTFELMTPLIKGCHVILYSQQLNEPARIVYFESIIEKDSQKKRPRMIGSNKTAIVKIETENEVCVDTFANQGSFGRFALRDEDLTIAAGIILKIEEN